jgi:hypothetical protein
MNSCIKSILPEGASPMDVPWMVISAIMPAFKVISRSVDGVCMMWYWWHLGALYQWLNFKYQCLVFCQFMNNDYQYYQWVLVVINMNCTVDGYEDFNYPAFVISLSYLDCMNGSVTTACYVMARPHLLGVCSLSITQLSPIRKGLINE